MSFKLLNLRHAQKSKFRDFLDQKPSNLFRRFLSFAFVFFFLPLFFTLQVAAEGEENTADMKRKTSLERSFDTVQCPLEIASE